jgi:hypothetical protein
LRAVSEKFANLVSIDPLDHGDTSPTVNSRAEQLNGLVVFF